MAITAFGTFFPSIVVMTYAQLMSAMAASQLVKGWRILVTDLCDQGLWVDSTSPSTVSLDGEGVFLNVDWQGLSDYTNIGIITGIVPVSPPITQLGQWHPAIEQFTITSATFSGTIPAGESVTNGTWSGVVVSDDGAGNLVVYSRLSTQYPVVSTTITASPSGETVVVDAHGTTAVLGNLVIFTDPTSNITAHYQVVDETALNGDDPEVNQTAYMKIPRTIYRVTYNMLSGGTFSRGDILFGSNNSFFGKIVGDNGVDTLYAFSVNGAPFYPEGTLDNFAGVTAEPLTVEPVPIVFGYLPVSNPVYYDMVNNWLQMRDDGRVRYEMNWETSQTLGLAYNPMNPFQWGKDDFTNIHVSNGWFEARNSVAARIKDINVPELSILTPNIGYGLDFKNIVMLPGVSFENKTIVTTIQDVRIGLYNTVAGNIDFSLSKTVFGKGLSTAYCIVDITVPMRVKYSALAGGPFEVNETIQFDNTGTTTAVVASDDGTYLVIDRIGSAFDYVGTTITQTTGANAGATATIDSQYAILELPPDKDYCNIQVVSDNVVEWIDQVVGSPAAFEFIVRPVSNTGALTSIKLYGTPYSTAALNEICLFLGTTDLTLSVNSDSVKFSFDGTRNVYVDSSQIA